MSLLSDFVQVTDDACRFVFAADQSAQESGTDTTVAIDADGGGNNYVDCGSGYPSLPCDKIHYMLWVCALTG